MNGAPGAPFILVFPEFFVIQSNDFFRLDLAPDRGRRGLRCAKGLGLAPSGSVPLPRLGQGQGLRMYIRCSMR